MLVRLNSSARWRRLTDRVARARTPSVDLMSEVMIEACERVAMLERAGKTGLIERLLEARAWTPLALALVEIELPRWQLRRLLLEDGEWLCSISRDAAMPLSLDDCAEGRHADRALAIVSALLEAKQMKSVGREAPSPVPMVRSAAEFPVSVEDFS